MLQIKRPSLRANDTFSEEMEKRISSDASMRHWISEKTMTTDRDSFPLLDPEESAMQNSDPFGLEISQPIKGSSYYRSKLFCAESGINPLVMSCAPLLSCAERLKQATYISDLSKLHQELVHEIKAFENKAQNLGYRSAIIHAARFVLCVTLDEVLLNSEQYLQTSEWEKRTLVNNYDYEHQHSQQFFTLLSRCLRDPGTYLDLLELMYLCLNTGFKGDYRHLEKGHEELNQQIETLYDCIRQQRGVISKKLETQVTAPHSLQASKLRYVFVTAISIALATTLLISYGALSKKLHSHELETQKVLQQLTKSPKLES